MSEIERLLVGQSAPMKEVRRLIELAAPSTTTILIQAETGVGKEIVVAVLADVVLQFVDDGKAPVVQNQNNQLLFC